MPVLRSADSDWTRRAHRADLLASEQGPAAPLLDFYARVIREQARIYDWLAAHPPAGSLEADAPLIAKIGVGLLRVVTPGGPNQLVNETRSLLESAGEIREELLLAYWHDRSDRNFFAKAVLQPYAEFVARNHPGPLMRGLPTVDNRCPRCGGAPQLSVLETGPMSSDGSSRQLQCANCLTMWSFRRVVCASCGEEDERKLAFYRPQQFDHIRVDACDSCGRYLKTIDLGRLGLAIPLVDEVAAAALDVWARERGYDKIELNLIGL